MKLEGLHHLTMITGDAQRNVDFYAGVLGLRLVKKTVNFDSPDAYHLYFGDEAGLAGHDPDLVRVPGRVARPRGRGDDPHDPARCGVRGVAGLLGRAAARLRRRAGRRLAVLRGLRRAAVSSSWSPTSRRGAPSTRRSRPSTPSPGSSARGPIGAVGAHPLLTETLGFTEVDGAYRMGDFTWTYDPAPAERGLNGAGTVHHIAWASRDEDHLAWRARVGEAGMHVTTVQDRDYFRSIYFREPRGILFEIATLSPGFAIDEDPDAPRRGAAAPEAARAPAGAARAAAHAGRQPAGRGRDERSTR